MLYKCFYQLDSKTVGIIDIKMSGQPDSIIPDIDPYLVVLLRNKNFNTAIFSSFKGMFIGIRKDLIHDKGSGDGLVNREKYLLGINLTGNPVSLIGINAR